MALSKAQVDKLGDRLRRCEVPSDDDLRMLSDFREERRKAMDSVGAVLAEIVGLVPARRLKTINSIVDKLRRESARLSQVQDIAGLRIVRDMSRRWSGRSGGSRVARADPGRAGSGARVRVVPHRRDRARQRERRDDGGRLGGVAQLPRPHRRRRADGTVRDWGVARFLLTYDRHRGSILREVEFADDELKRAVSQRLAEEIAHKADPNIEVVLLEADSRQTLLITHARYFKTVAEIARSL
ncbi:MAG: hypothetical protein ACJ73E_06060 [Mycobacteriales bacterium]